MAKIHCLNPKCNIKFEPEPGQTHCFYCGKLIPKSFKIKKTIKLPEKGKNSSKWILLAFILPFIYLAVVFPFLQRAEGNPVTKMAEIGEKNLFKIVFIYGFLTALTVLASFWKKFLKPTAISVLICWILGSSVIAAIVFSDRQYYSSPTISNEAPSPLPLESSVPKSIQINPKPRTQQLYQKVTFSGPELWETINKTRIEHGVGQLGINDLLCVIASYRLHQLTSLGKLDNHEGFIAMEESNHPINWILKKIGNVAEFLVYVPNGTALDAVNMWLNTLTHKTLLTGGQFTFGCSSAWNGFGVAIVGF